jgi:putative endonuclease
MKSASARARGWIGEELAAQFLSRAGYLIRGRNIRYGRGELDIVCQKGKEIIFVEVKTRRSVRFGKPEESITARQEKMLKQTAMGYLQDTVVGLRPARFDIVAVTESADTFSIRHSKNVFSY